MKAEWLRRDGAGELILVLSGWAVGAEPFRHLQTGADVLVLSDWRDLAPPPLPPGYGAIDLAAYSFGVGAACRIAWPVAFRRRVAVCGSWMPCDDDLGIPRAQVAATEAGLDAGTLRRFGHRAGVPLPPPDLPALREELRAVIGWDAGNEPRFDRVVLGAGDRVFPLGNLLCAWRGWQAETRILACGHNPFATMRDWAEILA